MTRDGGRSWSDVTPGAIGLAEHFDDAVFLGARRGWTVAGDCNSLDPFEVYRAQDGGATWHGTPAGSTTCNAGAHMGLEFIDPSHGWLLRVEPTAPFATLQRTSDGGRSWTRPERLPTIGEVRFHDSRHGWLQGPTAGAYSLLSTHDGGMTWDRVKVPQAGTYRLRERVFDLPTFFGDTVGVLPLTMVRGGWAEVAFYVTADGGETWSLASVRRAGRFRWDRRLPFRAPVQTHVFGSAAWLIVSGDPSARRHPVSIHVTRDGGRSWTARRLALPHRGRLEFVDPRTAWLMPNHGDRIYRTTDGGRSWKSHKVRG